MSNEGNGADWGAVAGQAAREAELNERTARKLARRVDSLERALDASVRAAIEVKTAEPAESKAYDPHCVALWLTSEEYGKLHALAQRKCRSARGHAMWLIRSAILHAEGV